jgi:uncharacterized protein
MGTMKKARSACLTALIATMLLPVVPVWAAEGAPAAANTPSGWAAEDVELANLHQLASGSLFDEYQALATKDELSNTGTVLFKKLTQKTDKESVTGAVYEDKAVTASVYGNQSATRQEAAIVLYNVIKSSHPDLNFSTEAELPYSDINTLTGEAEDAVRYMASKAIIQGKADGRLDLADPLTREQLLILVKRTYEFVLQETNTASKGLIWKISGGKSPVYVLGSIHIADISMYPIDNLVQGAYESSKHLAVEADIVQDNEGILYMSQKAVYSDGSTLDKNISAETYKLFADKMTQLGYPAETYNILKPWYAALLLQNLSMADAAYTANFGLDVYFLADAKQTEKSVLEVEGIKFQVDMFEGFSSELQEQFLLSTLVADAEAAKETAEAQAAIFADMLSYWKTGDAAKFAELIAGSTEEELGASEFNRVFWHERNKHMAETVEDYLADPSGDSYFVVVGAGHLFGETGVLKELEKAGYKTEQLLD